MVIFWQFFSFIHCMKLKYTAFNKFQNYMRITVIFQIKMRLSNGKLKNTLNVKKYVNVFSKTNSFLLCTLGSMLRHKDSI